MESAMNWKFPSGTGGGAAPVRTAPTLGLHLHPQNSRSIPPRQQLRRAIPYAQIQNRCGQDQIPPTKTDIAPGLAQRAITPPEQSAHCSRVILSNLIQIDHMPKRGNIARATILVIGVVCMLPII